jgi:predicted nucleotide-binding protein
LRGNFTVDPWYGVFQPGQFVLETLLNLADKVDAAILIFSKDDSLYYRGELQNVARANVILEYGLFLGKLDRDRVWIFKEKDVTLASDFAGLNYSLTVESSRLFRPVSEPVIL